MMNVAILSLNTAVTLCIGLISFFTVWNLNKRMKEGVLKEFSERLLLVIGVLTIYVGYWGFYNASLRGSAIARYPLYLALIFVFIYLMWSVLSFKELSEAYGMTEEDKMEKMERQELGV